MLAFSSGRTLQALRHRGREDTTKTSECKMTVIEDVLTLDQSRPGSPSALFPHVPVRQVLSPEEQTDTEHHPTEQGGDGGPTAEDFLALPHEFLAFSRTSPGDAPPARCRRRRPGSTHTGGL